MQKIITVFAQDEQRSTWDYGIQMVLGEKYEVEIYSDAKSAVARLTAEKESVAPVAVISGTMKGEYETVYRAAGNIPFILLTADRTAEYWKQEAKQRGFGQNFSAFMKENFEDGKPFKDHFETVLNSIFYPQEVRI